MAVVCARGRLSVALVLLALAVALALATPVSAAPTPTPAPVPASPAATARATTPGPTPPPPTPATATATATATPAPTRAPTVAPTATRAAPSPSATGASPVATPATASASASQSSAPTPAAAAAPPGDTEVDASVDATVDAGAADDAEADPRSSPEYWSAFVPTDVAAHLAMIHRAAAESRCGLPWQVLAAIARVESDFGRNMNTSSAGAIGYGQFLPSSWDAFGGQGNAYDYRDALPAIARYLCSAGAAHDLRGALFAYNHADWYVDMVLAFAVRYDHMAPDAPVPQVLDAAVSPETGPPLRYAAGRDTGAEPRWRTLGAGTLWLGVPFHPRVPVAGPRAASQAAAAMAMVAASFGAADPDAVAAVSDVAADDPSGDLMDIANVGWGNGLLPMDLFGAPYTYRQWTLQEVRDHVAHGHPVVTLVDSRAMPGEDPLYSDLDHYIVIVGLTPDGFIYNDGTFSTFLGYGLEVSSAQLEAAWQNASIPRLAVAFMARPAPAVAVEESTRLARAGRGGPVMDAASPTPLPKPKPTALLFAPAPAPAPELAPAPAFVPEPPPDNPSPAAPLLEDQVEPSNPLAGLPARLTVFVGGFWLLLFGASLAAALRRATATLARRRTS